MKYKFKTKPYGHQITALEKSWDKEEYGYFMEMCTVKSKVFIDNYILSQKTKAVYASLLNSGYGQVAYLSGLHEQGYDIEQDQSIHFQEQPLENISPMSKEDLISY